MKTWQKFCSIFSLNKSVLYNDNSSVLHNCPFYVFGATILLPSRRYWNKRWEQRNEVMNWMHDDTVPGLQSKAAVPCQQQSLIYIRRVRILVLCSYRESGFHLKTPRPLLWCCLFTSCPLWYCARFPSECPSTCHFVHSHLCSRIKDVCQIQVLDKMCLCCLC